MMDGESAPKAGLGRIVRIAIELAAMVALLWAVDHLLGSGNGFTHFQPNPYWLPVLVMAVTYGSWAGLAAAGLCTLVWLATNTVQRASGDYLDYMFAISLPPLLWYTAAVILGEVTDSRKRMIRHLTAGQAAGKRNMDRLVDAFHTLAQNNRVLQLRITTEDRTVSEALAIAARLPSTTGAERQAVLRAMVAMACRTDDFTCYRVQSGRAWPVLFGDGCSGARVPLAEPLTMALRERRAIIHVADPSDRSLLAGIGLLALPVPARDAAERMDGVVVLHDVPFACLGPHLNADLTALAGWLAGFLPDTSVLGHVAVVRDHGS